MKISDFDYNLPEDKISNYPPVKRGESRLLVLNKNTGELFDKKYIDISEFLNPGDVLVLNETKVIKARLQGIKDTGGHVEIVVLEKHGENFDNKHQKVMYKGSLKAGDIVNISTNKFTVQEILGNGIAALSGELNLYDLTDDFGEVPIPPYMKRKSTDLDVERYQAVFGKNRGSVAAPTASLNFTDELKKRLEEKGVIIKYLTLHVGLGTFLPVREDDVEKHDMHSEYFDIPADTINAINEARKNGNNVAALGTTVTRTLEFAYSVSPSLFTQRGTEGVSSLTDSITGEANIFIYPGFEFKIVDKLITNFHAPRSTVLLLANAFAGVDNLKKVYDHALKSDYKFLSYGDSMMII